MSNGRGGGGRGGGRDPWPPWGPLVDGAGPCLLGHAAPAREARGQELLQGRMGDEKENKAHLGLLLPGRLTAALAGTSGTLAHASKPIFHPGQVAQLAHHPEHQKVAGLIPRQGTYAGFGFNPQSSWVATGGNRLMFLSPSLSYK